jgi:hypothetical protein
MVMVASVMFGVPMPNSSPDLTDKVEAALLSQVSEIADQVCDGMLVTSAAVLLKNSDGLGGPGDVVGFIGHLTPRIHNSTMNVTALKGAVVFEWHAAEMRACSDES